MSISISNYRHLSKFLLITALELGLLVKALLSELRVALELRVCIELGLLVQVLLSKIRLLVKVLLSELRLHLVLDAALL